MLVIDILIGDRLQDTGRACARLQNQVPNRVQVHPGCSRVSHLDWIGIRSRGHVEVKLQLFAAGPVHQVHTGIHLVAVHLRIGGDARMPLRGIIADQIVHNAGQSLAALNDRALQGAGKSHADHRIAAIFLPRCPVMVEQDRLVAGQKSRVPPRPSQESNLAIGLTLVRFEVQRNPARGKAGRTRG